MKNIEFYYYRYVKGELPKNTVPTIGVEFATKTVTLPGS